MKRKLYAMMKTFHNQLKSKNCVPTILHEKIIKQLREKNVIEMIKKTKKPLD